MNSLLIAAALGLSLVHASAPAQRPADTAGASPGTRSVGPLFDDEGIPQAPVPWAIPNLPEHSARSGLYATEVQAAAYERAQPGKPISVRVDCCGEQGLDEAMLDAWRQYVARDASRNTPVFVRGRDPRSAARLADRLDAAGFAPVFLVTVP